MSSHVVFVCSGNICRSPFAEYLARDLWADRDVTVSSAGTWATPGHAATPDMVTTGAAYGLDLTPHRATSLDAVASPDIIFGMEGHHVDAARAQFPDLDEGQIRLLDPAGVGDPYGRGIDVYARCADQIAAALNAVDLDGI